MVEEVTLSKLDDVTWGFRMTGGLDFGTPLTIIKVSGGSKSEEAGLRVGDMIFGLNGQSLVQVTHKEAHEAILQAGNCLTLSIVRGSLILTSPKDLLQNEVTPQTVVQDEQKHLETVLEEGHDVPVESSDTEPHRAQEPEGEIISPEDKIEYKEVVPNEAQESSENQTPEKGQEGKELIQPEPIQTEQVLQETKKPENVNEPNTELHPLTEEELEDLMLGRAEVVGGKAIGVDFYKFEPKCEVIEQSEVLQVLKEEKCEEPEKIVSKFLQIPQRPKVKPKKEDSPKPIPYKPIIKIPKKGQTNETHEENVTSDDATKEDVPQNIDQIESNEEKEIKSSEKEELEELPEVEKVQEGEEVQVNENSEDTDQLVAEVTDGDIKPETVEDRIAQIQNQLAAIMTLPAEIQQHLSKVQQELADILKVHIQTASPEEEEILQQNDPDEEGHEKKEANDEKEASEITKDDGLIPSETEVLSELETHTDECENQITSATEVPESSSPEEKTDAEEQQSPPEKHKKDIQWHPESPKKNPPFFPLTPQPRPLRLPGGKKLWQPKVNFDDAFIAETLSGNAEIIKGTTIGVNFHKFEKNYEHLRASPVYKMIHSEDNLRGGFKNRSKALPAESDYKKDFQNVILIVNNT